jgi:hypothetical protein
MTFLCIMFLQPRMLPVLGLEVGSVEPQERLTILLGSPPDGEGSNPLFHQNVPGHIAKRVQRRQPQTDLCSPAALPECNRSRPFSSLVVPIRRGGMTHC